MVCWPPSFSWSVCSITILFVSWWCGGVRCNRRIGILVAVYLPNRCLGVRTSSFLVETVIFAILAGTAFLFMLCIFVLCVCCGCACEIMCVRQCLQRIDFFVSSLPKHMLIDGGMDVCAMLWCLVSTSRSSFVARSVSLLKVCFALAPFGLQILLEYNASYYVLCACLGASLQCLAGARLWCLFRCPCSSLC